MLVFLAFLMLTMLLVGAYFTAYYGLLQAGGEVQKAGEAAVEQAIIYLFQYPTEVTIVNGNPAVKGETRIVIQNVGSKDISFDRILVISPAGSVIADVKVPGNKGLGVRQWQMYKVQDLGLPDRWSNFDVFRSEVARLVLLSERGRTHGSIWGVPPFLEGVLKAKIVVTVTGSYGTAIVSYVPHPSPGSSPQQPPPEPKPEQRPQLNCTAILNDPSKKGSREWCDCAHQEYAKKYGTNTNTEEFYQLADTCDSPTTWCLTVKVEPCCSGTYPTACLTSWSGNGGTACATLKPSELMKGVKKKVSASWSASWGLKEGWVVAGWGISSGNADCSGGPSGGTCTATVPPDQSVTIHVVFEQQKSTTTTTTTTRGGGGSGSGSSGSGSGSGGSGSSSGSSGGSSSSSSQPSQQQSQQPSYSYDPTQQYQQHQQQQQNPGSSQQNRPPDYAYGGGGGGGPGVPKYFT
jgi:hypothetical protein